MVVLGTLVCHNVEFVILALDDAVIVVEALEQYAELTLVSTLVENLATRGTLRARDEDPAAVIALPAVEVAQRMLGIVVDKLVGALIGAQTVVVDLLELVL